MPALRLRGSVLAALGGLAVGLATGAMLAVLMTGRVGVTVPPPPSSSSLGLGAGELAAAACPPPAAAPGPPAPPVPPNASSSSSSSDACDTFGNCGGLRQRGDRYVWRPLDLEDRTLERRFYFHSRGLNKDGAHAYRRLLTSNGFREARTMQPRGADLMFVLAGIGNVPAAGRDFPGFVEGRHVANHIPGDFQVFAKRPLAQALRAEAAARGCDYTAVHPETFVLDATPQGASDCLAVFAGDADPGTVYFAKPTGVAAGGSLGRGIRIQSRAALAKGYLGGGGGGGGGGTSLAERCAAATASGKGLIVQRAVEPLLLRGAGGGGHKFDLRVYVFVAARPWTAYLRFGYVRRCWGEYREGGSLRDRYVCNAERAQGGEAKRNQATASGHHLDEEGLIEAVAASEGLPRDEVARVFRDRLHGVVLHALDLLRPRLDKDARRGHYVVLGADIAVGSDLSLRVLEANTNPYMVLDSRDASRMVRARVMSVIRDTLELATLLHERAPMPRRTRDGFVMLCSDAERPPYRAAPDRCLAPLAA